MLVLALVACNRNKLSDAYGNFEAIEITVSAEASGKILALKIEEGDRLLQGQVLGLIDTVILSLQKNTLQKQKHAVKTRFANLESQIRVQEQQRDNILIDKNRFGKMFNDGAATQKQLDDIDGQLKLIDEQIGAIQVQKAGVHAEMETIDSQTDQLNESIQKCSIINPIEGTVLAKYTYAGELANIGKPLYKIANMDALDLKVYISGNQLPHLKIGQEIEVLIDENKKENRAMTGRVTWISQQAEFTPKTIQTKEERVNLVYAVKVRVKNDGSLKIGMPGEINIKKVSSEQ